MADRSHLTPTPITDVNGKRTTVHRRPQASRPSGRAPLPPPVASTPARVQPAEGERSESYAERRARIAEGNALWRAGTHPALEALRGEAMSAMPGVLAAVTGSGSRSRAYAASVSEAISRGDFAAIVAAQRLADFHWALECSSQPVEDATAPLEEGNAGRYSASSKAFNLASSRVFTLDIVTALQKLDLLPLYEGITLPEVQADPRLRAHFVASVKGWAEYALDDPMVPLIDEFADSDDTLRMIGALREEGRDAEAIRAALGVERPLADGAL